MNTTVTITVEHEEIASNKTESYVSRQHFPSPGEVDEEKRLALDALRQSLKFMAQTYGDELYDMLETARPRRRAAAVGNGR